MDHKNELLTTGETAVLLRLQPQTLRVWRYRGGGPRYLKIGNRVVYSRQDIEAWLSTRRRTSTSDQTSQTTSRR